MHVQSPIPTLVPVRQLSLLTNGEWTQQSPANSPVPAEQPASPSSPPSPASAAGSSVQAEPASAELLLLCVANSQIHGTPILLQPEITLFLHTLPEGDLSNELRQILNFTQRCIGSCLINCQKYIAQLLVRIQTALEFNRLIDGETKVAFFSDPDHAIKVKLLQVLYSIHTPLSIATPLRAIWYLIYRDNPERSQAINQALTASHDCSFLSPLTALTKKLPSFPFQIGLIDEILRFKSAFQERDPDDSKTQFLEKLIELIRSLYKLIKQGPLHFPKRSSLDESLFAAIRLLERIENEIMEEVAKTPDDFSEILVLLSDSDLQSQRKNLFMDPKEATQLGYVELRSQVINSPNYMYHLSEWGISLDGFLNSIWGSLYQGWRRLLKTSSRPLSICNHSEILFGRLRFAAEQREPARRGEILVVDRLPDESIYAHARALVIRERLPSSLSYECLKMLNIPALAGVDIDSLRPHNGQIVQMNLFENSLHFFPNEKERNVLESLVQQRLTPETARAIQTLPDIIWPSVKSQFYKAVFNRLPPHEIALFNEEAKVYFEKEIGTLKTFKEKVFKTSNLIQRIYLLTKLQAKINQLLKITQALCWARETKEIVDFFTTLGRDAYKDEKQGGLSKDTLERPLLKEKNTPEENLSLLSNDCSQFSKTDFTLYTSPRPVNPELIGEASSVINSYNWKVAEVQLATLGRAKIHKGDLSLVDLQLESRYNLQTVTLLKQLGQLVKELEIHFKGPLRIGFSLQDNASCHVHEIVPLTHL